MRKYGRGRGVGIAIEGMRSGERKGEGKKGVRLRPLSRYVSLIVGPVCHVFGHQSYLSPREASCTRHLSTSTLCTHLRHQRPVFDSESYCEKFALFRGA